MLRWAGMTLSNLGVHPMSSLPSHPHAPQPNPDRQIRASITASCYNTIPHWRNSISTHTHTPVLLNSPPCIINNTHKMCFNTNASTIVLKSRVGPYYHNLLLLYDKYFLHFSIKQTYTLHGCK